jgi:CXXC-20-CXXC protein
MTNCKKCKRPFSSNLVYKSFWKGYKDFKCLNCQTNYQFSSKDRLIGGIVVGTSTFLSGLLMFNLDLELMSKLGLGILSSAVLSICLSLFSIKFLEFKSIEN